MFVPIGDDNPLKEIRFQYVTVSLIAANILVFLLQMTGGLAQDWALRFAVVPAELFAGSASSTGVFLPRWAGEIPAPATLVSYMFFHGDAMHLIGNMLFLWVFGDNVEDAMGHARFLAFYLACGIAAALLHSAMLPDSHDALIGASGAISGVISAYLLLHPRVGVWVLALKVIPLRITAAVALGLWIVFQLVMLVLPQVGPTAWWAHIGGLIAGAVLIPVMRRPGVPLWGR